MKRANKLLHQVADPDNIRFAAWKAAKGKRHTAAVMKWFERTDEHVIYLRSQLLLGKVDVGNYRYFKVFEPKERQICASSFGEQVLHHSLMNVCHPFFEKVQIFDSYASRKGKGTYAALERAKYYNCHYEWYLKLDVKKFFESIHHEVLIGQVCRMFKDAALVGIFEQIIHSYEASPSRGLPIGNLTSQYFANHYLNGLDRFVKEQLGAKAYVRYMDDMVIWHDDKVRLLEILQQIEAFVSIKLRCALKVPLLRRTATGLPFLGYHIFPHYVRLLQKSKRRFLQKVRKIDDHYHDGTWSEAQCQRHILPLLAFVHHADTQILKKQVQLHLIGQSP